MDMRIVILHGWGSKLERWFLLKKELEKRGFEVALPYLPGFGSTEPPQKAWCVADYAQWVKERLPEEYFLAGFSFGGRVAIKLASQNPKGLKGLILINSAGIKPQNTFKRLIFCFLAKIGKIFFSVPPLSFLGPLARKVLYYQLARERGYFQAKGVMRETFKKVIAEDLQSDLRKIKIPTLILWGREDRKTPLKDGELINRLVSTSSLKIFSGSNHDLPLKLPKEVVSAINEFAKGLA
jgi:pimeloyl-ACP methyl ester carboxylesterase